jgi:predicted 3-demethylubiquinone-9 3-methyltransferase (glyoxalase superfamily)
MQNITPFICFKHQAEAAVRFYTSVFKKSEILKVTRYPKGGPAKPGSVMTMQFRLLGQEFVALNGGMVFNFTAAISFVVNCRTQAEVDYYWRKLSAGGKKIQCGWLEDKYGVSWQIVPAVLLELISDTDAEKAARVMQAMTKMTKIDIKRIERAAANR